MDLFNKSELDIKLLRYSWTIPLLLLFCQCLSIGFLEMQGHS